MALSDSWRPAVLGGLLGGSALLMGFWRLGGEGSNAKTRRLRIVSKSGVGGRDIGNAELVQEAVLATAAARRHEGERYKLIVELDCSTVNSPGLLEEISSLYAASTGADPMVPVDIVPTAHGGPLTAADKAAHRIKTLPHVALGGTFDRLHSGHKVLLTTAAMYATERIRVGVACDALLAKKSHADLIQSAKERLKLAMDFLKQLCSPGMKLDVILIDEFTGGVTKLEGLHGLVVSPETEAAGGKINEQRVEKGLAPLELLIIPYVPNSNKLGDDFKLSSSQLRALDAQHKKS